ncbi:HlyD family secretion protein [Nostoc sp. NIES-2111]|nr:HlyD family secretion protein [Nostoc sp. NIES-2111]
MVYKQRQSSTKPLVWWSVMLTATIAVITSTVSLYSFWRSQLKLNVDSPTPTSSPTIKVVTALGYLEPEGEVIRLSAPNSQGGVRVAKFFFNQGSWVRQGQIVAIVDSYYPRLAALEMAKKQVLVAQASLNQVKAGAKAGDISAQKATIARLEADLDGATSVQQATIVRLEAELANVDSENQRYQQLYKLGAISASEAEAKYLRLKVAQQQYQEAKASHHRTLKTIQQQLNEAKAKLKSMTEVRLADVEAAQAIVESTKAAVKQAQAELELSTVRSPITGQLLKINTRPGEVISNIGIADLGRTQQMYVVAEIYETDIKKIRLGQSAVITSDVLPTKLHGTVTDIGLQLGKQNIFNNLQTDTDNKVIEVKIRINNMKENQKITTLTNLQVQVNITI